MWHNKDNRFFSIIQKRDKIINIKLFNAHATKYMSINTTPIWSDQAIRKFHPHKMRKRMSDMKRTDLTVFCLLLVRSDSLLLAPGCWHCLISKNLLLDISI
jgi:hypothetical protein